MPRQRSFWAWGYEDRFPSVETREALAKRIGAVFGKTPELRALPEEDALELPKPRFHPPVELRSLGSTDPRDRALHTRGRGYPDLVRGFAGDFTTAPDWVFYPTNEEQLLGLFRFCETESIAVVPFGGGTSVVGGVEHAARGRFRGTASIDLTRMDRVLELDATSRLARIQGGASGPRIAEQLAPAGLSLRHYPQSYELSTLGGWIATRAGGHFATLHTHIDDLVASVRMLTPAGVLETRKLPASGAGPAPERLVLGSEGAFGVITEAWVRVQPRPRWRASASVRFARFADGASATRVLAQSGLHPSNCRLLDAAEAMLHRVGSGAESVLLLAFESADHPLEPWMERALSIATDLGGTCEEEPHYTTEVVYSMRPPGAASEHPPSDPSTHVRDAEDAATWKQSFLDAPYLQSALVSMGVVCDTFETACTWDRFEKLHAAVTRATQDALVAACGAGVVTCRFTHVYPDGPAVYFTFLGPGRAGEEIAQWTAVKTAATEAVLASGGTVTHHHAVGRVHRPFWEKECSPLVEQVLVAAKAQLDPRGVLNPGCLLPSKD